MGTTKVRANAPKAAAFLYAGYKWFEDHVDDVERWSDKAIAHSRGRRYEGLVVPAARAACAAARWVRANGKRRSGTTLARRRG